MPHLAHADTWTFQFALTAGCVCAALLYLRGWLGLRSDASAVVQRWRAVSFLLGLLSIWIAVGPLLASLHAELLTGHMVQHLLIMTVGAPLILLGAPARPFLLGLPSPVVHAFIRPIVCEPLQQLGQALGRPVVCWIAATATLVGWHIPPVFTLAMHSGPWRAFELASFFATGLLFWRPVVRAWREGSWAIVLYLFLATLPCDVLSAFLVFSDRVVYTVYLSTPPPSGLSVLEDQQLAGALMWTVVTLVYLAAAAVISVRLLSQPSGAQLAAVSSRLEVS
jgi:putative membrane protein